MKNKLDFLRDYNKDIRILTGDLSAHLNNIPEKWGSVFTETDEKERVKKTLDIWEAYVSQELRLTYSYLKKNLLTIDFTYYNEKYAILYGIKCNDNEKILYYEGLLNLNYDDNPVLKQNWENMPKYIVSFYENIHNGFYYYPSHSSGFAGFEEVMYFDDYEWGILEELDDPIQINLKSTFAFFTSGGGGYLAIDINNPQKGVATVWYDASEPEYNIDFWDVLDEWIVIGFQS